MNYKNLLIRIEEEIAIIVINREKALNALNALTISELDYFFKNDGTSSKIKGIIITGAGEKAFIAGADIKEFIGLSKKEGSALSKVGHNVFNMIENYPKPVIAAINGFALGGGLELAMACHIRIAGKKARFGQPEVNLGLIPGYGASQRLIQYIGKGKAVELLMTADMIFADEAYRLGLVNHVVEPGEEIAKAKEILLKIKTKAPLAIGEIIQATNRYFDKNEDGFAYEIDKFGAMMETKDFIEGTTAFIEKRRAIFKGE